MASKISSRRPDVQLAVNQILQGHVLEQLKRLPDESIDMVITSPPYWGLRDYRTPPQIWDGHSDCEHLWDPHRSGLVHENRNNLRGTQHKVVGKSGTAYIKRYDDKQAGFCSRCGAWRGSLGLEPTLDLYIKHLCDIFDEVKRVLKPTGSCWVNLGDTYAGSNCGRNDYRNNNKRSLSKPMLYSDKPNPQKAANLPAKSLCLIPYRFAIEFKHLSFCWFLIF